MEIHHHPKHSDKPRKYREYLFEFLVIFVAISGSFFAENLREHFIDKHKEKGYMQSMLQDLKTDTASLADLAAKNQEQLKGIDSLLILMEKEIPAKELKFFYTYDLKYCSNYNGFMPLTRTISQLMNTGGLGLVRIKTVSEGIVNYNNEVNAVIKQGDLLYSRFTKVLEQKTEVLDMLALRKLQHRSPGSGLTDYPALLTTDKVKIHSYYFNITIFKGAITGYNQRLEALHQQAGELIRMIRTEYDIQE